MTPEDAVRQTYATYNARDLPRALENLASDVEWDDGTGNMLRGKAAVAAHWREQWQKADAKVEIETLVWQGPALVIGILLDVRAAETGRSRQKLRNTIAFSDGLIRTMRIG